MSRNHLENVSTEHPIHPGPAKKPRRESPNQLHLNPRYEHPTFVTPFTTAFTSATHFSDPTTNAHVGPHPFVHAVLPNIIDPAFLEQVKQALLKEQYYHKSNDLYEFYQSEDFKITTSPCLAELRDAIYSPQFVDTMSRLTGLELDPTKIDLSAHQYHHKGYLLCHDDDIKDEKKGTGRRIAFIIYLVDEDWSEADGGALELFAADSDGYPTKITRSLVPKWNQMAFFKLSGTSYHQVAEVLTPSRIRLSISGWFHGPLKRPLLTTQTLPIPPTDLSLSDYIHSQYLAPTSFSNIRDIFLERSSIELQKFLRPEIYDQLLHEFDDGTAQWDPTPIGPAFVRRYRRLRPAPPTSTLSRLHTFFTSSAFATFLTTVTNLRPTAHNSEVRCFAHGDYTLLHDHAIEREGLDVVFAMPRVPGEEEAGWDERWGGRTHYVADAENLLTMVPTANTLSVVLRDEGVQRFVKYVNCETKTKEGEKMAERREISLIFYEDPEGGGGGDEDPK
ncbi:hypothetical protein BC936DRAFT_139034 [Jimgerdemannia flammicorona]|uniref:Fe2OG dioxygenase domain-containing protein n=1 Tax=Jimgerdemannia flammicorona TaxID=994334 RepID=A0A433BAT1_9FUNG|nr:hypothetical protein BC936DRAFT_139034 [Jimgerdemannia flammicorona]